MPPVIRKADAADLPSLEIMQREFCGTDVGDWRADVEKTVAEGRVWVADDGGVLVGYILGSLFGTDQMNFPNSVFMDELFVKESARQLGAGRALVEAFLAAPWPPEYSYFSLTHDPAEPHLTEYYKKFGFQEVGRTAAGNVKMTRNR